MDAARASATETEKELRETVQWQPETGPDGVDLGQIRSMLALTPTQRLERMQDYLDGIVTLRSGRKTG